MSDTATTVPDDDPLRERLLDAAARVFAEKGYDGTKIQTIVKQAGLSTGAVYGRFTSKTDLLRQAVITRSRSQVERGAGRDAKVADLVARGASDLSPGLTDAEAILLETYVTARREAEVAAALTEADDRWRQAVDPLVEAALVDGTVDEGVDPEAVLFLVRVLRLGILLHRGSGLPTPDADGWEALVGRVVASFGRPEGATPPTDPTPISTDLTTLEGEQ
ncbi:MAG TPA: helix-turn-helix domain-containing protein [Acidimicrobiales bacterium]|nr:helix-turn-helix domain-containing protein [Acidimicrobiales bacterium]